jgi:ABC-type sugar transport system ATPase subunit
MSDRIVVMHEGYQTAILDGKKATAESVMRYAIATVQMEVSNA